MTANTYLAEPIPPLILKELLDDNWISYSEIPKPEIVEANAPEEPYIRADISTGDFIIIRQDPSGETIKMKNTWKYYDRVYTLVLELWSAESRQRLYDMKATIRRIVFSNMWNTANKYQALRFGGFVELVATEVNIWHGQIRISFEDLGKSIDTIY